MKRPLYVVKLGSRTLLEHPPVFEEVAALCRAGARVLLVAGGSLAIERWYAAQGIAIDWIEPRGSGQRVRYVSEAHLPRIVQAYEQLLLPHVEQRLQDLGLTVFAGCAYRGNLVVGKPFGPLRVVAAGDRDRIRSGSPRRPHRRPQGAAPGAAARHVRRRGHVSADGGG